MNMLRTIHRLYPSIIAILLLVGLVMGSFCTMLINADDQTIGRGIFLELIFAALSTIIGIVYLKIDKEIVPDFRYMLWFAIAEIVMLLVYIPLSSIW